MTFKPAPRHEPVTLFKDGQATASIVACGRTDTAQMLQGFIRAATGVALPITTQANRRRGIVLGDCPAADRAQDQVALSREADIIWVLRRSADVA